MSRRQGPEPPGTGSGAGSRARGCRSRGTYAGRPRRGPAARGRWRSAPGPWPGTARAAPSPPRGAASSPAPAAGIRRAARWPPHSGYEVIDLGINVSAETFVEAVKKERPELLGLSALLTTTMHEQRKVIEALEAEGLRKSVKVILVNTRVRRKEVKQTNKISKTNLL